MLEEHNANSNSLLAHYRYADRLLSLETTVDVQYYYQDALGSTVDLTDQLGTLKVSYRLDAWGHIRQQVGDSVNRQIFTGQEHDLKTGLIYFGSRYYDPDTARFISQDSYLGEQGTPPSLHRYLYAYSNPTVYTDLEGYESVHVWENEEDIPWKKEYYKYQPYFSDKELFYSADARDWESSDDWEFFQKYAVEKEKLEKYRKKWSLRKNLKDIYAWVKTKEKLTKEEDGGEADSEESVDPSSDVAKNRAKQIADMKARGLNAAKELVKDDVEQINEAATNPLSVSTVVTATYVIIEYTPVGKAVRKVVSKGTFESIKGRVFKKKNEEVFEKIVENIVEDAALQRAAGVEIKLLTGPETAQTIKHHIFNKFRGSSPLSQKYRDFFKTHNIDIDKYAVEMPEALHTEWIHKAGQNWTTKWKRWIDTNPNATTKEVYQQAGRMMDEFGINNLPIVTYP